MPPNPPKIAGVGRARLTALAAALVGCTLVVAACGDDEEVSGTLPPIATTSTTTTVLITTTTVQQFYVIQPGDTLSKIAESFGVDINDLMALNGITDPDHIEAGQEIEIPPPKVVHDSLPTTTGVPGSVPSTTG